MNVPMSNPIPAEATRINPIKPIACNNSTRALHGEMPEGFKFTEDCIGLFFFDGPEKKVFE
jgi:hypothetical protein